MYMQAHNSSFYNLSHLLGHIGDRTWGLIMGSLLVGDLSSKRLSFSRLRDLFRNEASLVPAAIIASGGFRRHPLDIRRVAAGEKLNPDEGEVTDTATV